MKQKLAKKSVKTNCRPAFPLDATQQFRRAVHAGPRWAAAVIEVGRVN